MAPRNVLKKQPSGSWGALDDSGGSCEVALSLSLSVSLSVCLCLSLSLSLSLSLLYM